MNTKTYGAIPSVYRFEGVRDFKVEWRGGDSWAIVESCQCYNKNGRWEFEPSPSNRTDEFIERTRWTLEDALRTASELIKTDPILSQEVEFYETSKATKP